jgi:hypothetical protein
METIKHMIRLLLVSTHQNNRKFIYNIFHQLDMVNISNMSVAFEYTGALASQYANIDLSKFSLDQNKADQLLETYGMPNFDIYQDIIELADELHLHEQVLAVALSILDRYMFIDTSKYDMSKIVNAAIVIAHNQTHDKQVPISVLIQAEVELLYKL